MSERVDKILALFNSEEAKAANFRTLYQDTADLIFPREDRITNFSTPGDKKHDKIIDETGVMASIEMASGLSQSLFPPGQRFFVIEASEKDLNDNEDVKRFLGTITDSVHEELFNSNFFLQSNETLRSLSVFGTGCLFSEFTTQLNFRDYDIGAYLPLENKDGIIDGIFVEFEHTAQQAFDKWGESAGRNVLEALQDMKTKGKIFKFIHYVQPRGQFNPTLSNNLNMPWESVFLNKKEKIIVEEKGFDEFPYSVVRWAKSSNEVFGRGQGLQALPNVRMLQWMKAGLIENANKQNNPPLEVLDTHENEVRVSPGAINNVGELGTIAALERGALGNFAITKDILEIQQTLVKKTFFNDVFVQLADLKGDRRTTVEIRARIAEGLRRIGPPIGRLYSEWLTPQIERVILLLGRNGRLPLAPPELQGRDFKIEYIGQLALELKSFQANAAEQWLGIIGAMTEIWPDAKDIPNVDSIAKRIGATRGVNTEDINTNEIIENKREARLQQQQLEQQLLMAQAAGQAYKDGSGAAEEGSPSRELQEA